MYPIVQYGVSHIVYVHMEMQNVPTIKPNNDPLCKTG